MGVMILTMETIGQRIKRIREEKGLTKYRLSKRSGISETYIYHLEAGHIKSPRGDTLVKLAKGLEVSVLVLLYEDGLKPGDYVDTEFKSFIVNELPGLDEQEIDWLRRTINMVRERKRDREKYQAGEKKK